MTASTTTNHADSKDAYEEKFCKGYGVVYPEGHIIRFYERILKRELGKTTGKVLDFGSGIGTHARYLIDKGYDAYCVDVSDTAIKKAKEVTGKPDHCKVIPPNGSIKNVFGDTKFDIIFCNQSLYYLPNDALARTMQEFHEITNDGAILFATMMSQESGYYRCITANYDNGLSEVTLTGRLNEKTFIRFVADTKELVALFPQFPPLHVGDYVPFNLYDDGEGSSHHFIYIGQKK